MDEYKTGYNFDNVTGELTGTETVWLEKATGTYPHAGNVTLTAPPEARENKARCWDGKKWKMVTDYRGTVIYTEDGYEAGTITELGDDIKGKITLAPPIPEKNRKLLWTGKKWETPPADGYIEIDGVLREMTWAEKIEAGLEDMPEGCKIEDGKIVSLNLDELYDAGKITLDEYNERIRQKREREYRNTTDKIGLMILRGEATEREWKDAILAVKVKYPYKEA